MQKQFNPAKIRLIIGLGNKGVEYENTYHNIGANFVQKLAETNKLGFKKHSSHIFEYAKNEKILVIPLVFMNKSGHAASAAIHYFKIKPEETLVVHDDSDISIGLYKISFDQKSAGHKGIESIINEIGTQNFWRLKIGIRNEMKDKKQNKRLKASEFVLSNISSEEKKNFSSLFSNLIEILEDPHQS
jgi:PTH1 family peptidyl-tRNA hydrolase